MVFRQPTNQLKFYLLQKCLKLKDDLLKECGISDNFSNPDKSLVPSFREILTIGITNSPFSWLAAPGTRSLKWATQSSSSMHSSQKVSRQCLAVNKNWLAIRLAPQITRLAGLVFTVSLTMKGISPALPTTLPLTSSVDSLQQTPRSALLQTDSFNVSSCFLYSAVSVLFNKSRLSSNWRKGWQWVLLLQTHPSWQEPSGLASLWLAATTKNAKGRRFARSPFNRPILSSETHPWTVDCQRLRKPVLWGIPVCRKTQVANVHQNKINAYKTWISSCSCSAMQFKVLFHSASRVRAESIQNADYSCVWVFIQIFCMVKPLRRLMGVVFLHISPILDKLTEDEIFTTVRYVVISVWVKHGSFNWPVVDHLYSASVQTWISDKCLTLW